MGSSPHYFTHKETLDGAEPHMFARLRSQHRLASTPTIEEGNESDGQTVHSVAQRKDVVLAPKKPIVAPVDDKVEEQLLKKAADPKETFLFQKKHLEAVVTNRIKSFDTGKGLIKALKTANDKVVLKSIIVSDLSSSYEELLKNCKAFVKDLKGKKQALPGMKKGALPALNTELQSSAAAHKAHTFPLYTCPLS